MSDQGFYGFRERQQKSNFQCLAMEIVTGCQLRCGNCYRPMGQRLNPIPASFVKRAILEAKSAGFTEIVNIGGEPTLHPQLPQFIEWTLKEGLTPILCTNGLKLANQIYCQRVIQPGTTVVIHGLIPAPNMDKHVRIDGYTEKLKQAYRNLELLRSQEVTVVAEAVVIKPFLPYLLEFHKWCRENGYFPFIEVNRRGNNGQLNELTVSPEEVRQLFGEIQQWDKQHAPDQVDSLLTPPAYGTKCTMSITGLHLKNFGENNWSGVYSCCAQTVHHGDLSKQTLEEIIADPGIQVFKDQDNWIFGPCKSCEHYNVCKGGCRGEASLAFGCPRASCPACWLIPKKIRHDPAIMAPPDCQGCPLEGNTGCRLPH